MGRRTRPRPPGQPTRFRSPTNVMSERDAAMASKTDSLPTA
jgi:hypothetical protein